MDFTLTAVQTFPAATSVAAYKKSNWPAPDQPSGAPVGSPDDTQAMGTAGLTFTGLAASTDYWAVGEVGGQWRYIGFKTDAAAAAAPGGSSAQVFEVSDLLIPSGTDWSGLGHALGSFEVDVAAGHAFKVFLEVDAPVGADDIFVTISDDPDYSQASAMTEVHVTGASDVWNLANNLFIYGVENGLLGAGPTAALADIQALGWYSELGTYFRTSNSGGSRATHVSAGGPVTVYADLHTSGPTAADITVVRARAAFLVI
jgi:hypothetical protein